MKASVGNALYCEHSAIPANVGLIVLRGLGKFMLKIYAFYAVTALSLSACAGLGSLKYQGVVEGKSPPSPGKQLPYREYFKVEVSSTIDIPQYLERSSEGPVYAFARLCPASGQKDVKVIAFGPFEIRQRQRYDIYLVARHPETGIRYSDTFLAEYDPYDLARDKRDVCITLSASRFPAAVRSEELRVPAEAFSRSGAE